MTAIDDTVLRKGYLHIQWGVRNKLYKRYIVIKKNGEVSIWMNDNLSNPRKNCKHSFLLKGGETIITKKIKNDYFRFKIQMTDSRHNKSQYVFGCESDELKEKWIASFSGVLKLLKAIERLQEALASGDCGTVDGQLRIACAWGDCGQLIRARNIYSELLNLYRDTNERIHLEYEDFLAKKCKNIIEAENHFGRRRRFFCLPKEFLDTEYGERLINLGRNRHIRYLSKKLNELSNLKVAEEYNFAYENFEDLWEYYLFYIDPKHLKYSRDIVAEWINLQNSIGTYKYEYSYVEIEQQVWYMLGECIKGKTGNAVIKIRYHLDQLIDDQMQKKMVSEKYASKLGYKLSDMKDDHPPSPIPTHHLSISNTNKIPNDALNRMASASAMNADEWDDIMGILDELSDTESEEINENTNALFNIGESLPQSNDEYESSSSEISNNAKLLDIYSIKKKQISLEWISTENENDQKYNLNVRSDTITDDIDTNILHTVLDFLNKERHHFYPWTAFMLVLYTRREDMQHIGTIDIHMKQIDCIYKFIYLFTKVCLQQLHEHSSYALLLATLHTFSTVVPEVQYNMCLTGVRVIANENVSFNDKIAVFKFMKAHQWLKEIHDQKKTMIIRCFFLGGIRYELGRINNALTAFYRTRVYSSKYYGMLAGYCSGHNIAEPITRQDDGEVQSKATWGPRSNHTYDKSSFELVCNHRYIHPVPVPYRTKGNFDEAYLMFCCEIAKKLDASFQLQVFSALKVLDCDHSETPPKTEKSCYNALLTNLSQYASPRAARILDYCRCVVAFSNVSQIISAFRILEKRFQLCHINNLFADKQMSNLLNYKYMDIYLICKHQNPKQKFIKLICEVRLTLRRVRELDEERNLIGSKMCFGQGLIEADVAKILKEVATNVVPDNATKQVQSVSSKVKKLKK